MTSPLVDVKGKKLEIRRGTSPSHVFRIKEQGIANPKNLTGASEATFAIASGRSPTAVRDLTLTLGDGVVITNPAGGEITVTLSIAQTELLPVGVRWAELWITDSAGRRDIVGEGVCVILDTLVTVP